VKKYRLSSEQVIDLWLNTFDRKQIRPSHNKWNIQIKETYPDWARAPLAQLEGGMPKFRATWTNDENGLICHLSEETKKDYHLWLQSIKSKKPIDLNGEYSYLRYHFDFLLHRGNPRKAAIEIEYDEYTDKFEIKNNEIQGPEIAKIRNELKLLLFLYLKEPFPSKTDLFPDMFGAVISLYLKENLPDSAVAWWNSYSKFLFKHRHPSRIREKVLSLKYKNNYPLTGSDFLLLNNRPYWSKIVKQNSEKIIDYLDEKIASFEAEHGVDLLKIITLGYAYPIGKTLYMYKDVGEELQTVIVDWLKEANRATKN
jgi:hypothetical protein